MAYVPEPMQLGLGVNDLAAYLARELDRVSAALEMTEAYSVLEYTVAPARPRDFMLAATTAVNWDPGAGPGVYVYISGAWKHISRLPTELIFRASIGTDQVIAAGATTKLQMNTETFDPAAKYDAVTNYRFLPGIAGKYQINAKVALTGVVLDANYVLVLNKNGVVHSDTLWVAPLAAAGFQGVMLSDTVELDGNDYLELALTNNAGSSVTVESGANVSFWSGHQSS